MRSSARLSEGARVMSKLPTPWLVAARSALPRASSLCAALLAPASAAAASRPGAARFVLRGFAAKPRVGEAALALGELRLICDRGTQLGVMPPADALRVAAERELQLVEVAPSSKPPVWKLLAPKAACAAEPPPQAKAKPKRAKPSKPLKVKEVRVTDSCEDRDLATKASNALRFLGKGHVVRLIALNTGRVDKARSAELGRKVGRAEVLVGQLSEACREASTSSGVTGRTSTEGGGQANRVLGVVTATLTPKPREAS